jgi:hypothetical protein
MKKKIFNRNYTINPSVRLLRCLESRRHSLCNNDFCEYCGKEKRISMSNQILNRFSMSNQRLWSVTLLDPNNLELENIKKYHLDNLLSGIWVPEIVFKRKNISNWYENNIVFHYHAVVVSNDNPVETMRKIWNKYRQLHVQEIYNLSGWANYMCKMFIDPKDKKQTKFLDNHLIEKKLIIF